MPAPLPAQGGRRHQNHLAQPLVRFHYGFIAFIGTKEFRKEKTTEQAMLPNPQVSTGYAAHPANIRTTPAASPFSVLPFISAFPVLCPPTRQRIVKKAFRNASEARIFGRRTARRCMHLRRRCRRPGIACVHRYAVEGCRQDILRRSYR